MNEELNGIIKLGDVIHYRLVQFRKRVVFDILYQREDTIWDGEDDGDYFMFIASNDFQIISRSRMDIQTERLWLLGAKKDSHADRSGTMVFAVQDMLDRAYPKFHAALKEWAVMVDEVPQHKWPRVSDYRPKPPVTYRVETELGFLMGHFDEKEEALQFVEESGAKAGFNIIPLYL